MNPVPEMTPGQIRAQGIVIMALLIGHAWMDTPLPAISAMIAVVIKLVHPQPLSRRPRFITLALVAVTAIAALIVQGTGDGFSATAVRALVVFAGLKFLESRTLRDLYVLVHVALFLLATLFLVAQTMFAAVFGFAVVLALTAILVEANTRSLYPTTRAAVTRAWQLMLAAMPLTMILFVIFPRLASPLWSFHQDAGSSTGITGLSDRMTLGSISEVVRSGDMAFRALFDGPPPAMSSRYWRGPVLWHTDGRNWLRRYHAPTQRHRESGIDEEPLGYQLILEPHGQRWVPVLDHPVSTPQRTTLNEDLELVAISPLRERTRYVMASELGPSVDVGLSYTQRTAGLQLPDELSPRVRDLARGWRQSAETDLDVVNASLAYFSNETFHYTLRPPPAGADPVDEFLFESRRGFCEHYAAAFAILMRSAGIPARVVTGYQGGEVNPHNGYLLVHQSDAHAWNEVWIEGKGWVRVDPTAAVAPVRVERGLDVEASLSADGAAVVGGSPGLWRRLSRQAAWLWDALDTAWYTRVVNFDQRRQHDLWNRWGLGGIGNVFGYALAGFALAVILGLTWFIGKFLVQSPTDHLRTLYDGFCRKLARRGMQRAPNEGPSAFINRISDELSADLRDKAWVITRLYLAVRYGPAPAPEEIRALKRSIRRFHP